MDGSASRSLARKGSTHTLDQEESFYHQAAAGCENKGGTGAPASSLTTNINYGRTTQGREDNVAITARYRYHLTIFQHMAFMLFLDDLEKTQEPHKLQGAESLGTLEDVLEMLDVLEAIEGLDEEDANTYRDAYGWVKRAWDACVRGLGLSAAEYNALMQFKKEGVMINEYEEDHTEEEAEAKECLRYLQDSTAKVLVTYKKPLIRLLNVLLGTNVVGKGVAEGRPCPNRPEAMC